MKIDTNTASTKAHLVRMRRKSTHEEEALIRERLTAARLMNGFSPVQAQERFDDELRNIGMIEMGKQPLPKDHEFLSKAAQVYSVSLDFLYGLSPNPERDVVFSERYALMRGFEAILTHQLKATTDAFFKYAQGQDKLCRAQYQNLSESVDAICDAMKVARQYGFDELRGGAAVLSSIKRLEDAIKPVRRVLAAQQEIERYCKDLAVGKVGPISYLTAEYWAAPSEPCTAG